MGFLREQIKNELMAYLGTTGCPPHIVTNVADIPEGQHDQYLWAHLKVCEQGLANQYDDEQESDLFWRLSATVAAAIQDEAVARGMTERDFPQSRLLSQVVEAIAARQAAETTKH